MNIRELVGRERELQKKIDFNIEEMSMLSDLETLPKYSGSSTIKERFDQYFEETERLVKEKDEITKKINMIEGLYEVKSTSCITVSLDSKKIIEELEEKYKLIKEIV